MKLAVKNTNPHPIIFRSTLSDLSATPTKQHAANIRKSICICICIGTIIIINYSGNIILAVSNASPNATKLTLPVLNPNALMMKQTNANTSRINLIILFLQFIQASITV